MPTFEIYELKNWFLQNRRDLPWRENHTPYRVWISEIMLQQTRAAAVIPYFEKWFIKFPTVEALAQASMEEVLKAWEGLGYYSRARMLHKASKKICDQFGGVFPSQKQQLEELPGFGNYTVGAVLSFAFHQKASAVDGNVVRVLARYFGIRENVTPALYRKIQGKVEELLPEEEPWITMEALIELGSEICTPSPKCTRCPLKKSCEAYASGDQIDFPKKKSKAIEELFREVFVVMKQGKVLVCQRPKGKIMADLYEFPYVSCEKNPETPGIEFERWDAKLLWERDLCHVSHSFTHFKAHLYPRICKAIEEITIPEASWAPIHELKNLPFSSGHKKILTQFLETYENITY